MRIGDTAGKGFFDTTRKWGFIDKTERYVINPQFVMASSFSDGLAAVRIGDKWGFIAR